jgi:hypothetical protein
VCGGGFAHGQVPSEWLLALRPVRDMMGRAMNLEYLHKDVNYRKGTAEKVRKYNPGSRNATRPTYLM